MNALEIANSLATTDKMIGKTKMLLEKARRTEEGVTEIDHVFLNDVYEHMRGYQKLLLHVLGTTEE